ncbi:MAG: PQQ-binding-like beta-propeller repeat protein [Nitrospiraceae bacterium]|nr:PQQ-binding-like beta-propeller repeat protein [Nitrospiraceae bacterium]
MLAAPVNATWAANHLSYWDQKGFAGFLLSGIQDDLVTDVWACDGDPATVGREDALLREVRLAIERLNEGGLDRNFALVPVAPGRAYFADPSAAREAVGRLEKLGVFCRLAGLRGVAIDGHASDLFYDLRWDGYAYDTYTAEDVKAGARDFGRRAVRAILRGCPDAEILVIGGDYPDWGPLWCAFLRGMAEGAGDRADVILHFLTRAGLSDTDPTSLMAMAGRARRLLTEQWGPQANLAVGMRPLVCRGVEDAVAAAAYPLAAFRVQLAMAKVLSDQYVWVDGGGASWWRLTEKDAALYGGLFQNGAAAAKQTGPVAGNLSDYSVSTRFDDSLRVGVHELNGRACFVFNTAQGASLLCWEGVAPGTVLDGCQAPVSWVDLETGETREIAPDEGRIALPISDVPCLLERLPVGAWVLPASLWMGLPEPLTPESGAARLEFGFVNRTGFDVSGILETRAPALFTVKPRQQAFELESDAELAVRGTIRGPMTAGRDVPVTVGLVVPGRPPLERTFDLPVSPALDWSVALDGVVRHAPVAAGLDSDPADEVLVCTDSGEVVCLSSRGEVRWRRRFDTSFSIPPAVGVDLSGGKLIATTDDRGTLRVLLESGRVLWETAPGGLCCPSGPLFADLDGQPGDEIVVGFLDGRLEVFREDGQPLRTHPPLLGATELVMSPVSGAAGSRLVGVSHLWRMGVLSGYGVRKTALWRAFLPFVPVCAPAMADVTGDGVDEVLAVSEQGRVLAVSGGNGRHVAQFDVSRLAPVTALVACDLLPGPGPEFVVWGGKGLACLSHDFEAVWLAPLNAVAAPAVGATPAGPRILVPVRGGALACLDASGALLWRDERSSTPLSGGPLLADLDRDGRSECVYPSSDRVLRSLIVPGP